jgi:hypothetical protein
MAKARSSSAAQRGEELDTRHRARKRAVGPHRNAYRTQDNDWPDLFSGQSHSA